MSSKEFPRVRPHLATYLLVTLLVLGARVVSGQAFTVIHSFDGVGPTGAGPGNPGLIKGTDGNFYGKVISATDNSLMFFQLKPNGAYATLHTFTNAETPVDMVSGGDGFIYVIGNTGSNNKGIFYKVDYSGAVTVIHDFGTMETPVLATSLMKAADGNFYAISNAAYGDIWQITPGGTATHIFGFTSFFDPNGFAPLGRLVDGGDGKLYDDTIAGGANGFGTFFRVSYGGAFEQLHDFTQTDGPTIGSFPPDVGLIHASDGNFYYASPSSLPAGQIVRYTTAGDVSVLTSNFGGVGRGVSPAARLLEGPDGNLYGTTLSLSGGGGIPTGTLYQVTPSGSITFFKTFVEATDGGNLEAGLVLGDDGLLYGVASQGGPGAGAGFVGGTAFQAAVPPSALSIAPSSGPAAGGTAVTITGTTFVAGAGVQIGGAAATGVSVTSPTTITATTPALSPGTLNDVQVTNPNTAFGIGQKLFMADFLDVPQSDIFHSYVEKVFRNGITAGCGGGNYCRNNPVTRAQMAVFLLKAEHGSTYVPPFCTGIFSDVQCPSTFADWIERLAAEGITGGCGTGVYCPNNPVTRQQMAVFLLKTEHGSGYAPPGCAGLFGDVACPSTFADWIEQLYAENVTGGCQVSPLLYCPGSSVLRGQMATFLVKTFNLP